MNVLADLGEGRGLGMMRGFGNCAGAGCGFGWGMMGGYGVVSLDRGLSGAFALVVEKRRQVIFNFQFEIFK